MALNSLIGVELGAPTEVEDSVSMVVVNDVSLWSDGGAVRPELKIATEQIRMAESEKKLVLSKYRPQFYVGVDGSYSSPGYNFRTDITPYMQKCPYHCLNGVSGKMRNGLLHLKWIWQPII